MSRPLPTPTKISAPFWDSCRRHAIEMQRCEACGVLAYYPTYICPECGSDRLAWTALSGAGNIYSFTVATRAGFETDGPLVVALIELAEGPVMMSNIVTDAPERLGIGDPVSIAYLDVTDEISLPVFRPA